MVGGRGVAMSTWYIGRQYMVGGRGVAMSTWYRQTVCGRGRGVAISSHKLCRSG